MLDPSAMYRQQELSTLMDSSQQAWGERIAYNSDVQFVDKPGNIGMISNSAGLCMASDDVIASYGGATANFADLGGSAIHEQIDLLLHILNDSNKVRVIFLHFHGSMMSIMKV